MLNFPLTRAEFMDKLPVQEVRFFPLSQREVTGLEGGEILTAEVAPTYWGGTVSLSPMPQYQAAEVEALLAVLEGPGRTFEVYRAQQAGPAADTSGASVASGVSIVGFDLSDSTLALQGLPANFQITAGDLVSFPYASGTRQALHRFAQSGQASAGGVLPSLMVTPHLRSGLTTTTTVTLVRPWCRAILVPGGVEYGTTRNRITSGMSFTFRQSLK